MNQGSPSASSLLQKLKSSINSLAMKLCKGAVIIGLILFVLYILFSSQLNSCPITSNQIYPNSQKVTHSPPTNISHIVFGLVGSLNAWSHRKAYIESWWRRKVTRGYIYLDRSPSRGLIPWSKSSPPLRISDNITNIVNESKHVAPIMVRMVHAILEVFREGDSGVRWIVMGDDDSIFFVDNWVDVLNKYDHTDYVYIGGQSETIMSNFYYSFEQGFGGAGFALSYPLVMALVKDLEGCLKRYPWLNSADFITKNCVDELGVPFSPEKGIHQIDLKGDISGFLSSHPQSPLLSLHHFDAVDPIFPSMNRFQSTNHLMKAAKIDQSRMLQQTICYHRQNNWSFSIAWGYSAHIYEKILPRNFLKRPLETFKPWVQRDPPNFMFNTRGPPSTDPCETPHVFFFSKIEKSKKHEIVTTYVRSSPRGLSSCLWSGNHSADHISKVRVFSPVTKLIKFDRSECCDIVHMGDDNMAELKYRACNIDEIIA